MPITKSAIKRVKLSEKQRQRNSAYKAKVKTLIKKFEKSLITENKEDIFDHPHLFPLPSKGEDDKILT